MKRVFLLIVVPALLVAMGFAQTPAASGNTDQINVKGCLGGSEGSYNVAEDSTGKIFRITTSSADLKAYQGQEVLLVGHKAGTADDGLAITEVKMITEHCAAAAAVPAAAVSAPAETSATPPAAPAAATPAEPVSTPAAAATPETVTPATAPDATLSMPAEAVSTPADQVIERPASAAPAPAAVAPAATVSTPVETASAPAAAAGVHRTRPSTGPRKLAATPAAAAAPADPVSKPVADAAAPTAPVGPPQENDSTPAAPVVAPRTSTGRSAVMLVTIVLVVLLVGAGVPLYNRWKRRKLLEETSGQNLSFTKEAKSDPGKSDATGGRKAA